MVELDCRMQRYLHYFTQTQYKDMIITPLDNEWVLHVAKNVKGKIAHVCRDAKIYTWEGDDGRKRKVHGGHYIRNKTSCSQCGAKVPGHIMVIERLHQLEI